MQTKVLMDNSQHDTEKILITPPSESRNSENISKSKSVSWNQTFAALKYQNYRLWFWGQMISLFGSWMQTTALGFFVFELTHSPAFLGYVGFANGIPAWLFTFYGGVIADRFSRRNILVFTQTVMMLLAFLLAVLTFTGVILPWQIILLAFFSGIATAFDSPARHAFVNELVEREHLINAIALNSTMFNTATAVGPAIAGITYAIFGPAWCFTINGISFLAVIVNLLQMRLKPLERKSTNKSILHELKEGFSYLKKQKMILTILLITTMVSLFGMGLMTLFPAWAVKILHGNAATNGLLQSARGVGAVICALIIAALNTMIPRGKILSIGILAMPVLLFAFSFNRSLLISLFLLFAIGGSLIIVFNLSNGLIQTLVTEEFRGRIMSIYSFSFFAFMPLAALISGTMAEHLGVPTAILINSIILFLFSIFIWFFVPKLKQIGK